MRAYFKPKSIPGGWSLGSGAAFLLLLLTFHLLVASGQQGGDTFFSNLWLTVPALLAAVSGISAFFTGIIGVVKSKERSVPVFLSTVLGLFVLLFVLGEFLITH